uniref:Immediate-early protein n=1 Tax=Chionoecetes opilio bacilliform virus TaxID=1825681 RepID=A0A1Q3DLC9_9VIRU|nr:immediate-early protein [Chionoecetes opilio bacilliform virus]
MADGETSNSKNIFKERWNMRVPLTARQFKNRMIQKNCHLIVMNFHNGTRMINGYKELCKFEENMGYENKRWQFFHFSECTIKELVKFLAVHQCHFFSSPTLSSSHNAVMKMGKYLKEFVRDTPPITNEQLFDMGITPAQKDSLMDRIISSKDYAVRRLSRFGMEEYFKFLLPNAYDFNTDTGHQQIQQECAANIIDKFGANDNAAANMAYFFKGASITLDDIKESLCPCKKCKKKIVSVRNGDIPEGTFVKTQAGRYLAKKLFEPMGRDEMMSFGASTLGGIVDDLSSYISMLSSDCSEVEKIMSVWKKTPVVTPVKVENRKRKNSATAAIDHLVKKKKEEVEDEEDNITWVCLRKEGLEQLNNDMKPLHNIFRTFDAPECSLIATEKAKNIVRQMTEELTVFNNVRYVPAQRYRVLPVTKMLDEYTKTKVIQSRAKKYFDGDEEVAALTFVSEADIIQLLPSLKTRLGPPACDYDTDQINNILKKLGMVLEPKYGEKKQDKLFHVLFGDGTTLSYFKNMAINMAKQIEHHMTLQGLSGAAVINHEEYAIKELLFDEHHFFNCERCKSDMLKTEKLGVNINICTKCALPEIVHNMCTGEDYVQTNHPPHQRPIFSNWKLTTGDSQVGGDFDIVTQTEKLNNEDKKVRIDAANAIISLRLNKGLYETNIDTVFDAVKKSNMLNNSSLIYNIVKNMRDQRVIIPIPEALCVECNECAVEYKASPLAPKNPVNRKCPWCRLSIKFVMAGEPGLALLETFLENNKNEDRSQLLTLLEYKVNELEVNVMKNREHVRIYRLIDMLREDRIEVVTGENHVQLAGYGLVKTGIEIYSERKVNTLMSLMSWSEFNCCILIKLLGYSVDDAWKSWKEFLVADNESIWKVVRKKSCRYGANKNLSGMVSGGGKYITSVDVKREITRIMYQHKKMFLPYWLTIL